MGFELLRNIPPDRIVEYKRTLTEEENSFYKNNKDKKPTKTNIRNVDNNPNPINVNLLPGKQIREKGTLQKAYSEFALPLRGNSKYDKNPLFLLLTCSRKWPVDITHQRYALVVSYFHSDPMVNVYDHIRQHAQVYQRLRVQL